jgi:hypothetical protein
MSTRVEMRFAPSDTSGTIKADGTSFVITATMETVRLAAPKAEAPVANLAVLDRAFGKMVTSSPKESVHAHISPVPSTFDDNLLLLGVAEYSQRPMTFPPIDLTEDGATSNDTIDNALTDLAVYSVLELTI